MAASLPSDSVVAQDRRQCSLLNRRHMDFRFHESIAEKLPGSLECQWAVTAVLVNFYQPTEPGRTRPKVTAVRNCLWA